MVWSSDHVNQRLPMQGFDTMPPPRVLCYPSCPLHKLAGWHLFDLPHRFPQALGQVEQYLPARVGYFFSVSSPRPFKESNLA